MRKILYMWVVLCLCFLYAGCEKGEDTVYYTDDLLLKNGINDVEKYFYNEITKENSILYYGLRRGKEWFALFDESTKSLEKEWYGKEISIKDIDINGLSSDRYRPSPEKIEDDEYLLWYIPCNGRINTNIAQQLIHLQTDGTVKYGKELTENDIYVYTPLSFLKGKGWITKHENGKCIFDSSFENITVEDMTTSEWESLQVYIGFNSGRLWVGLVNDQSILVNEYLAEKPFERKRKVHLGYGEYKEYTIRNVILNDPLLTKWGYAFSPKYLTTDNESISQDIVLLNDDKLIYCQLEDDLTYSSLRTWYKESILINCKYVISPQGEKLREGDFSLVRYDFVEYIIPTSYSSWMKMDEYGVFMYSIDADCVWRTLYDTPIASKSKTTYILLNQEENIWAFRCDIVHYDGSKEGMRFKVNIETGELTYF